jgi:hypothetical protein
MANWSYYDSEGQKQTVNSTELKRLAETGSIMPETIIYLENGKMTTANRISGLKFKTQEPEIVNIPEPDIFGTQELDIFKTQEPNIFNTHPIPQISVPVQETRLIESKDKTPIQLVIYKAASIVPGFGHLVMGVNPSTCGIVFLGAAMRFLGIFFLTLLALWIPASIIAVGVLGLDFPESLIILIPVVIIFWILYPILCYSYVYQSLLKSVEKEYYKRFPQ